MPMLLVDLGQLCFDALEVPDGCTVGRWKQLIGEGYFGTKVLYAGKLKCHVDGAGEMLLLEDAEPLPEPPEKMCVTGPGCVVNMLEVSLRRALGKPTCKPEFKGYRMRQAIGRGFDGVCVYLAEHAMNGSQAALKWPANGEEVKVWEGIGRRASGDCLGLPKLLAHGTHKNEPYILTELLGAPLTKVLRCLYLRPFAERLTAICIIGRMMVRRLQALHSCGYVHCDVSPENILFGHGDGIGACQAYLIDFGLARPYPCGKPLRADLGSMEWSSIRSAEGGPRRPEDDVEALGWILVEGLIGPLPWTPILTAAYERWGSDSTRAEAVRRVREGKRSFLASGWEVLIPRPLHWFLTACQVEVEPPAALPYTYFLELLGANPDQGAGDAEQEDLRQYQLNVQPFVASAS